MVGTFSTYPTVHPVKSSNPPTRPHTPQQDPHAPLPAARHLPTCISYHSVHPIVAIASQVIYTVLKPGERAALRNRLGAPLQRLLPQEESEAPPEEPPAEETAVVFLTEQSEGLIDDAAGAEAAGAEETGGDGDAAQVLTLDGEVAEGETETGAEGEAAVAAEGEGAAAAEGEAAPEDGGAAPLEVDGEIEKALPDQA